MPYRICSKCEKEKDIKKFVKDKKVKDGYSYVCKECRNSYNKKYNEDNKEKRKESVRKYYEKNKKNILSYHKKYKIENEEKILEYQKKYRKNNKAKIKKYRDKYRKDNKKTISNYNKKYGISCAKFKSFSYKLKVCEDVRKDLENEEYLQVRCTNCKNWFNPTNSKVRSRIRAINGNVAGECRLYCSKECEELCTIYKQILYPKGFKNYDNIRDSQWQSEWSEMVKERDGYKCVKCKSTENLEAHHIEGINENCIEMWDLSLGITFCHKHHKEAHSEIGCRFIDLVKKENFFGHPRTYK